MINKLGIIPAAGHANRFGGVLKELLPIYDKVTLIRHSLNAMNNANADAVLLITNRDKLSSHAQHLEMWRVYYAVQLGQQDIWSAIVESLPIRGNWNMFAMPDTYYPVDIFQNLCVSDFNIGCFETKLTERFGIVTDKGIVNKSVLPDGIYNAWGTLCWSNAVAEYWMKYINEIETYTQAFNMAIAQFGCSMVKMPFYNDLATIEDYKEFISRLDKNG